MLAGKTLFNFFLFLAIAAVTVPAFVVLLGWRLGVRPARWPPSSPSAGYGLAVVSTFLSALVARACQKNVLFVVDLLPAPPAPAPLRHRGDRGRGRRASPPGPPLRVIVAYDGAATCAGYLLAAAAWEE